MAGEGIAVPCLWSPVTVRGVRCTPGGMRGSHPQFWGCTVVSASLPASEHQRGQGVPGGPGWPRHLPPAARHRCHPVPCTRRGGRGAAAPQSRPGQDHPVALPPLPTTSTSLSPSPRHRPDPAPLSLRLSHVPSSQRDPPGSGWVSLSSPGTAAVEEAPGAGQRLCLLQGCAVRWDPGFQSQEGSCQSGEAGGSPSPERDSLSPPARSRRGPAALRTWVQRWAGGSRLRWGMESVCSLLSFGSAHPRPPTLG